MAIPQLKLNLVPPPTLWRRHHHVLGWSILGLGLLTFSLVTYQTTRSFLLAKRTGRETIQTTAKARETERAERQILEELRTIDVTKEMPRWKLAERILLERSLPWSRITAELERSLVQDMRVKTIQRVRTTGNQGVQIKLRGEARTRDAEVAFIESLKLNPFFLDPVFEREAERTGGGIDFDITLPVTSDPKTFVPLPQYGPERGTKLPAPAPPPKVLPVAKVAPPPASKTPVPSLGQGVRLPSPALAAPARLPVREALPDPESRRERPRNLRREGGER